MKIPCRCQMWTVPYCTNHIEFTNTKVNVFSVHFAVHVNIVSPCSLWQRDCFAFVYCEWAQQLMACLHVTWACPFSSMSTSTLTLYQWWCKCTRRKWVWNPFPASAIDSTLYKPFQHITGKYPPTFHSDVDANGHAHVTCKQSLMDDIVVRSFVH